MTNFRQITTVILIIVFLALMPAAVLAEPGGVTTNLRLWLKADAGTSTTTDGVGVSQWDDQSGQGNHVTQATGTAQPLYENDADNSINFNPVLDFVSNDFLNLGNFSDIKGGSDYSLYSVGVRGDGIINRYIIGGSTGVTNESIHFGYRHNTTLTLAQYHNDVDVTVLGFSEDPFIIFGEFDGTAEKLLIREIRNSSQVQNDKDNTDGLSGNAVDYIGRARNTYYFGRLAEIIAFNKAVSAAEEQQIQSYLALKYGITLDQTPATDYLASDGTTEMWDKDAAGASAYNNDIAGIGRDDDSALGQVKSKSVNSDAIVAILAESEGTNDTPAWTDIADLEFLTIGNNNGATTYQTTEIPSAPGGVSSVSRLTREWQVQETGDVGNVQISVLGTDVGSPDQLYLLTDADGDFSSGATSTAMTDNAGTWEITRNFAGGEYFTFAQSDLQLWMKADAGVYSDAGVTSAGDGDAVQQWDDQSGNAQNATQGTSANAPTYRDNATNNINFNPVLNFNGSDDFLNTNLNSIKGGNYTLYGVGLRVSGTDVNRYFIGANSTTVNQSLHFGYRDNVSAKLGQYSNDVNLTVASPDANPFILFGELDDSGHTLTEFRNSGSVTGANTNTTPLSGTATEYIGRKTFSTDLYFKGDIAEIIAYSTDLTATQEQQVNSYLALKYGITLDQATATDYLASDGTTEMWDASDAGTYNNDIAGIGRDDDSELGQVKSKSVNSDAIVTIEADGEGTNTLPSWSDIADLEFMTWGNNGGAATWTYTGAPAHSGCRIVSRIWSVQETGDVGTVRIEFDVADADFDLPDPKAGTSYFFVYDSDNDGTLTDESVVRMFDDGSRGGDETASDNVWTVNNINLSDGQEFTIVNMIRRRILVVE